MFLCNFKTERACLGRMIFGSPSFKWHEVCKITRRTAIFLYTLGHYPMVRGIFIAQKPPFYNCSGPYKGKFPAQVRVSWYHEFHPVPSSYFEFDRLFGGDRNLERKLSKTQTQGMIAAFVDHICRSKLLDQVSLVQNHAVTPNKNSTKKKKKKKKRKKKAHSKKSVQVQPSLNFFNNSHVLLPDGQPIPVYNPKGVFPIVMALTTLQPHVRPGFSVPVYTPKVAYLPHPKMPVDLTQGFQNGSLQAQTQIFSTETNMLRTVESGGRLKSK
jgi:hypothetical protein